MKTKIIYISGSEIFSATDIRAAFEEVRTTLGLDNDTVLFGVPVDSDDAGIGRETATVDIEMPAVDAIDQAIEIIEQIKPTKKTKKTTRAKAEPNTEQETPPENSEKIIPILSILSGGNNDTPDATDDDEITNTEIADNMDADEISVTQTVTISEMITDDAPEEAEEKTLERLLEKMAPLREDIIEDVITEYEPEQPDADTDTDTTADMDATLEQLATEFATKQDEIEPTKDRAGGGKIGKLKNILPFKKAKREESGLMGDLFGWAGIAANDDEFSIPGFFTTSASKK